MEETYTFSRALRLMRYSGKKMRFIGWDEDTFLVIRDGVIILGCYYFGEVELYDEARSLKCSEIMGSWVEVK